MSIITKTQKNRNKRLRKRKIGKDIIPIRLNVFKIVLEMVDNNTLLEMEEKVEEYLAKEKVSGSTAATILDSVFDFLKWHKQIERQAEEYRSVNEQ